MKKFSEFLAEEKVKWKKVPDGYGSGNKKVFKYVTSDGKFEIRLSGMDSMKMNRDGSQKVLPTIFDKSGKTPKHPVEASRNLTDAKKKVQDWRDTHGV
jgi:hypothetical protein